MDKMDSVFHRMKHGIVQCRYRRATLLQVKLFEEMFESMSYSIRQQKSAFGRHEVQGCACPAALARLYRGNDQFHATS
jgi:hypothetical protein